jgi:hypothetical protein
MTKEEILAKAQKVKEFFALHKMPLIVTVDEKAQRFERLIAFHKDPSTKTVEEKFESVLLADGTTKCSIDPAVEAGAAFVIETPEGPVAAPVGEYELQDGRIIVVTEPGMVAEVKEVTPEGEVETESEMADQKGINQQVKSLIERTEREQIFAKVAELVSSNAKLKADNEKLTVALNKMSETFSKFEGLLVTVLDEPVIEPVVKTQETFSKPKNKWAEALK